MEGDTVNRRSPPIPNRNMLALGILLIISLVGPSVGKAVERDVLIRERRAVSTETVESPGQILENVQNDVPLFNLAQRFPNRTFVVTGNVAAEPGMFSVSSGQLRLAPGLSAEKRRKFDYDTYRTFAVYVNATSISDGTDVVNVTVNLRLQDVNDEVPVFTNIPRRFVTTIQTNTPPGTEIFRVTVTDPDENPNLEFRIDSASQQFNRFTSQQASGGSAKTKEYRIITVGDEPFNVQNSPISLRIIAEDTNGVEVQLIESVISVTVGVLPPQFYQDIFRGRIYETTKINKWVTTDIGIQVKQFQPGNQITFELLESNLEVSRYFDIIADSTDPNLQKIRNISPLDYEGNVPNPMNLIVRARESASGQTLSSTASVIIDILDDNDNVPVFSASQYSQTVREDTAVGQTVLRVTASDRDSGLNGQIEFSLTNSTFFTIRTFQTITSYVGEIIVERGLDYERREGPTYGLTVIARDKGAVPASSTAQVTIYVTNVNDNDPAIDTSSNTTQLIETAQIGAVVRIIQATDVDGDRIKFYFGGMNQNYEIFSIEENNGLIKLRQTIPAGRDSYTLTVLAVDDDSCCTVKTRSRTSSALFTVNIVDINANKPSFDQCRLYDTTASVKEKASVGTEVIVVSASDPDRGDNGKVLYRIESPDPSTIGAPFQIDAETGNITVQAEIVRNTMGFRQVTVVGRNPGNFPLMEGRCTFRVTIQDINDNPPVFSQSQYSVDVSISTKPPSVVRQMVATDADVGANANLTYYFGNIDADANSTFSIHPQTGVIRLIKEMDANKASYTLTVIANDQGVEPGPLTGQTTVIVNVNLEQRTPPSWVNLPPSNQFSVSESAPRGFVVTTLSCQSNSQISGVEYRVFDASGSITSDSAKFGQVSFVNNGESFMNLTVIGALDYETQREHKLSVVCQTFSDVVLRVEYNPEIIVQDANDQVPTFEGLDASLGRYVGTVREDAGSGTVVLTVSANDGDTVSAFNTVNFQITGVNSNFFEIRNLGANKADIVTTPSLSLDREEVDHYSLELVAQDSAPASPPNLNDPTLPNEAKRFIDINVIDVNDNPPNFSNPLYTFNVSEMANINELVAIVTANDPDRIDQGRGLNYLFISGNVNNAFSILAGTGQIRVARKLDFDNPNEPKVYDMILRAVDLDQLFSASTSVRISVLDANDNRPEFTQAEYIVENVVTEEDTSISQTNPLFLVQVQATDRDTARPETQIRYSLVGPDTEPGPDQKFRIDQITGDVFLVGVLDRDTNPVYSVTVRAEDERQDPLLSYSVIKVRPMDINDNAPLFQQNLLRGSVDEHATNRRVMTVIATDLDAGANGTVNYRMAPVQTAPNYSAYFRVNTNGDIFTGNDPTMLDREEIETLNFVVEAYDLGSPQRESTATVTITLNDINDQSPYFEQALYYNNPPMSEAQTEGEVLRIPVIDKDSNPRNKDLRFELRGDSDQLKHFLVRPVDQSALITIQQRVDYEQDPHSFSFELYVSDGMPGHENTTNVVINVEDFNDNPPIFTQDVITITRVEEEDPGQLLANFNATDIDEGINAEFEFSIVRSSDPRYEFYVHPTTGEVINRKRLDREVEEVIEVIIMAKDKGEPPLNSTARLIVTLTDINDNAPRFRENYRPVVPENEDHNNLEVVEIFAEDPDTDIYGPPFNFMLPPNCATPACQKFQLDFIATGDNNRGTALIRTSERFDREQQKEYHLPIVMSDMRGQSTSDRQSATNTLTIVIGDKNDNPQKPGHQDIFVYNYEGQFKDIEIGRVYVDDPDDWDLPDKSFTFSSPEIMKNYFSVNRDTGVITMKPGVPNTEKTPFQFEVSVYDRKDDTTVICTVSVIVQHLSDESVWKSGGVRLAGITAEEFVKPSAPTNPGASPTNKYSQFRTSVAKLLGYPGPENIDIVSMEDGPGYLDVRFSGHASPFVNPSQAESALLLKQGEFERDVGVTVAQVPINLCMEEIYDTGCYNHLTVTGRPHVINANGTSYVVMNTTLNAATGCVDEMFPEPVACRGDYCFNGGTCHQDDWGKLSCSCPAGFDGPRCQQRRHNFDGNSIAFYKSLSVCSGGRTSMDFITEQENGLILYSGPVGDGSEDQNDYMILELEGGYPSLRLSLGTQEVVLKMNGQDRSGTTVMDRLSDGEWHHLDIDRDNQKVILTVDRCKDARAAANGTVSDWSPCRMENVVPGPDVLLNVQSLLQLGGRYWADSSSPTPAGVTTNKFNGCLKNLVHNSKLYDLHFKTLPDWNSGNNGCPREERICGEGTDQPVCGQQAMCESRWLPTEEMATCRCHPGWFGQNCDQEAPVKDLSNESFLKWQLDQRVIDASRRMVSVQMMFRTRQTSGSLMTLTNAQANRIQLELIDGKLTITYDLGSSSSSLTLSNAPANTGQWHLVRMERYGSEFILSMDGGEGRKYDYHLMDPNLGVFFEVLPFISAGARVPQGAVTTSTPDDDLVQTCVQDIRYNDIWLPMVRNEQSDPPGIVLMQDDNVVDGCVRDDCPPTVVCPDPFAVCYPLWELNECRCIAGYHKGPDGGCVSVCDSYPCHHGGTCTKDTNGQAVCECVDGFRGPFCMTMAAEEADDSGLGAGAIVGIVLGILLLIILIILLLLFLLCRRGKEKDKILEVVDPDDDFIRENVMFYDEEGAGEEDHDAYDITLLQRPDREAPAQPNMYPDREDEMGRKNAPRLDRPDVGPHPDRPDVGSFINDRIKDTEDDDPLNDSTREFNFEGGNSDAGSLSSLNSSSTGGSQDYDYLGDWGPKFAKLADMYGAGQNLEN